MKTAIGLTFAITITLQGMIVAQEVLRAPESTAGLENRWKWAIAEARQKGYDKGIWIAYSVDLAMGENSWIGSFHSVPEPTDRSFYEIITGLHIDNRSRWTSDSDDDVKDQARRALSRSERKKEEKKVMKEVAFLFGFGGKPSDVSSLQKIYPTNVELEVDLKGKPLIWLGKITPDESVEFLAEHYKEMVSPKQKQRVIVAVGIHKYNSKAFEFLRSIVKGNEEDRVRDDAAFWIGQQDSQDALEFLVTVAQKDESRRVSEKAIFAISQIGLSSATDVLIDLGRNGSSSAIRKKAVFWLGQRASRKVVEALRDFAYEGDDADIQKQAVFALSQIHDEEAITEIIKIAKSHPDPRVRKQAIFWLGDSDDPRAFDAIVEIAKGK